MYDQCYRDGCEDWTFINKCVCGGGGEVNESNSTMVPSQNVSISLREKQKKKRRNK